VVKAGVDPLSTKGSELNGGRYNERGMSGVLYTAMQKSTAIAEVVRGLKARGVNPRNFGPEDWWVYEIRVEASKVLDLEDAKTRSAVGVNAADLVANDTGETRRLGKYARDHGFHALRAPSAAELGKENLVLFLDKLPGIPEVISSAPADLSAVS
jgi:RES domain-containing protein